MRQYHIFSIIIFSLWMSFGVLAQSAPSEDDITTINEHYRTAWVAYREGDMQLAYDTFNNIIEIAPDWSEGYVGRAIILMLASTNFEDAITDLERANELNPQMDLGLLAWHMFAYNQMENPDVPDSFLDPILETLPPNYGMLSNTSRLLLQLERYADAQMLATEALSYNPTMESAYSINMFVSLATDDTTRAQYNNLMQQSLTAMSGGDMETAQSALDEALALTTDADTLTDFEIGLIHYLYAAVAFNNNDADSLLAHLTEVQARVPEFGASYVFEAYIHNQLGDTDAQLDALNRGNTLAPNHPYPAIQRGLIYEAQDMPELALADHRRWLSLTRTRAINWLYFIEGETFSVVFETGWQYGIPLNVSKGDEIRVSAVAVDLPNTQIDPMLLLTDLQETEALASNDNETLQTLDASLSYVVEEDGTLLLLVGHGTRGDYGLVDVVIDID